MALLRNAFVSAIVLHALLASGSPIASLDTRSYAAKDHNGAVASESSVCSNIGIELMKCGGNAADAMVGTVLCVGTIGMYHSGIGGGGFMLVRDAKGQYEFIDFREKAPAAAFEDMYKNNVNASIYGGLASGVPGELRGLEHLHKKYGKLPWKKVVMPAVNVARNGFKVTADLVKYMNMAIGTGPDFLVNDPNWAIDFAPKGYRVKLGETITRKRLADTLEVIAHEGPDVFYKGAIGRAMIDALQKHNGTMTMKDLAEYQVAIRKPQKITYRGYTIHAGTSPCSGAVLLSAFKTVEAYDMSGKGQGGIKLATHYMDEAVRFGYGERAELGDPSFVKGMDEYQAHMISEATAQEVRGKISDQHTLNVSAYNPKGLESLETPGTSGVATSDKSGMTISLTTTINLLFGSQLMVPETGVIMNNEMNDFSIPGTSNAFGYIPSPANYVRPGKRPLSSISPTIVENEDGSVRVAVGAAGGSRIITSTIQAIWNVLDRGMNSHQALLEPRFHDQLAPNQISFEYAYNNDTVSFMKSLGHNVTWVAPGQSSAQCIRRLDNGTYDAAGEPRQLASGGFAF